MATNKRRALVCIAMFAIGAHAAVRENIEYAYYDVAHVHGQRIPDQIRAASPNPQRWFGYTRWHVRWDVRWNRHSGACALTDVAISLTGKVTLPRLDTRDRVAYETFTVVNKALKVHEEGHVEFGRNAARRIDQALAVLPSQSSCEELNAAVNRTARSILDEEIAAEKEYDLTTQHGKTQGAWFD